VFEWYQTPHPQLAGSSSARMHTTHRHTNRHYDTNTGVEVRNSWGHAPTPRGLLDSAAGSEPVQAHAMCLGRATGAAWAGQAVPSPRQQALKCLSTHHQLCTRTLAAEVKCWSTRHFSALVHVH